ncbi:MAG: peptidylprolyl isomerase [Chitinophagales bacterium]
MQIAKNKVGFIHYELKNEKGEILDSSAGREPLGYIQGIGNLIPGLEKELEGKKTGDKLSVVIAPEDAYGTFNPNAVHVVPKSGFQGEGNEELQEGMRVQVDSNQGVQIAMVTKIEGENVTLDLNHPLAGVTLYFSVEIMGVRDAEAVELEHGHVHGPGGHHH